MRAASCCKDGNTCAVPYHLSMPRSPAFYWHMKEYYDKGNSE